MKKRKILLLVIILLGLSIGCIIGIIVNLEKSEENKKIATGEVLVDIPIDGSLKQVSNRNNFYIVQNCIEGFYNNYTEMFKDPLEGYLIAPEEGQVNVERLKNESKQKVYSLLDGKYLAYKEITTENIDAKLSKIGKISVNIQNMYYVEDENNISAYFVKGTKKDNLTNTTTELNVMVKIDLKNRTYKILLNDYVENFYKDLKLGNNIEIEEQEIKNDKYNIFSYQHVTEEEYVNDLFEHFKTSLKVNREQTYNLIDEQYKKQCFENSSEYLSYINSNYTKLLIAKLDTYSRENKSGYTQYTFKDTKDNYYTFKETAPFQYKVLLDNYVIPTEDFTGEYNKSNDKNKVVLNIKKFFMGIEDKNYGYSYSVLSTSFKNNKYPTKNDFINYAQQNFFEENNIQYISCKEENGLYIYNIKITDATGKTPGEKEFNMIVKLNKGTDFEMSFGEN